MPKARYAQAKICDNCAAPYYAARKNSRFCSDKCRIAWHRFQQRPDAEKTLFVLVHVINANIESRQRSIEARALRLRDATGFLKQGLEQLIREDEQQIELLQMLLRVKNNLETDSEDLHDSKL